MGTILGYEVREWPGVVAGTLVLAGGLVAIGILRNQKVAAFVAEAEGIRIGSRRRQVEIPWREIREISISPAPEGAQVDIVVMPSAPLARRRLSPRAEILVALIPGSLWFLKPPLLAPVTNPAGYRAPLWGVTADQVAEGLRPLAPDGVPIAF